MFIYRPESLAVPIGWEHRRSCDTASKHDLLWHFFPGDIEILVNGTRLATDWASVPALHFVASLHMIKITLAQRDSSTDVYNFTEEAQQIIFRRDGPSLSINCTYAPGVAIAPFNDFAREVPEFGRRLIANLGKEYPSLLVNPYVKSLLGALDSRDPAASVDPAT